MTDAPPSVSVNAPLEVLLPPEPGLPYLRSSAAGALRRDSTSIAIGDGCIRALEADDTAALQVDARDCALIPGFVDAHTHLPFVGWRASEYEQEVAGTPYEQIARSGGGIQSSARAWGSASDGEILGQSRELAAEMLSWGTTAIELKSGYGLAVEQELRALRIADELTGELPQAAVTTALLAHSVPPGYSADEWLDCVEGMLPDVKQHTSARALDIYVESVAFTNAHLERMGALASAFGFELRCHAEQFATHRSVPVALAAGARSVDHLACLHADDLEPLAKSACAAVLLPGAEFLGREREAPARQLADAGAVCVVATDANPGTSPIVALPVAIGIAVRRYGWTAKEALLATTLNPAWVLGMSAERGTIEVGKRADLVLLDGPIESIAYRFGHNPVVATFLAGKPVYVRPDQRWRLQD